MLAPGLILMFAFLADADPRACAWRVQWLRAQSGDEALARTVLADEEGVGMARYALSRRRALLGDRLGDTAAVAVDRQEQHERLTVIGHMAQRGHGVVAGVRPKARPVP